MRAAVVGAGLTGLAAAWELTRRGIEPVILESEPRPGGIILTERRDGFIVEAGPDGFLASEPELPALAAELGIGDRLVNQLARGSFLWNGARLEPLPEGRAAALLGIDTQLGSLAPGFRSFAGGMEDIVTALVGRLPPQSIRTGTGVQAIIAAPQGYRLTLTDNSTLEAGGVILAVQAWVMARLLTTLGFEAAPRLEEVPYWPSITVSIAYRRDQVGARLEGTGFVSGVERGGVLRACTYASSKYPGRAPAGFMLLRAFLQGPVDDAGATGHAELARILEISGQPLWARAFCSDRALPRYKPGHALALAAIRERLAAFSSLALAGAAVDGAGVSACVRSGRAAARAV